MKIIQITDFHRKNEDPFFAAGVALSDYLLGLLRQEKEAFVFLDSGDHFHVSRETGRVNGEVVRFFLAAAEIDLCSAVFVMQGNHDAKEDTGSALDVVRGLHYKISVIDKPLLINMNGGECRPPASIYLLPYARPYSMEGYSGVKSYGEESFHKNYWEAQGEDWETIKARIKMVSFHGGDETTGKLFMNADISFLPGIRSNGHIHKQVSKNCLPSVSVTRRDEAGKKCYIRRIDPDNWAVEDAEIPLFLNYAQIPYGGDIDEYFKSLARVMPLESLIVDIYGHDDKDLVIAEYSEKWALRRNPKLYVGEVTPVERRGDAVLVEERGGLGIGSINIRELFSEFCEEKKLAKNVADDLARRIG